MPSTTSDRSRSKSRNSRKKSPRMSYKTSKKSSKSPKGSRKSPTIDLDKLLQRELARKSRIAYYKRTEKVGIYLKNRHVQEIWNEWIDKEYEETPANAPLEEKKPENSKSHRSSSSSSRKSRKSSKSRKGTNASNSRGRNSKSRDSKSLKSRSSKSPKNKKSKEKLEPAGPKPIVERGNIEGVILFRPLDIVNGKHLYLETKCAYKYYDDNKSAPYPENFIKEKVLVRNVRKLYPINMLELENTDDEFFQEYINKLRNDNGDYYDVIPFRLDISSLPDSVILRKPHDHIQSCGVFWSTRVYISKDLDMPSEEEDETVQMTFCKRTLINLDQIKIPLAVSRELLPSRCETKSLVMKASMERTHFSMDDEIRVKVDVKNSTSAYEIAGVEVIVYQVQIFNGTQDRVVVGSNFVANLNAKQSWNDQIPLTVFVNKDLYNVAIEGLLDRERNSRLASSTFPMMQDIYEYIEYVKVVAPEPVVKEESKKTPKSRSRSSSPKSRKGSKSPGKKSKSTSPKSKKRSRSKGKEKKSSEDSKKEPTVVTTETKEPPVESFHPIIMERRTFRRKNQSEVPALVIEYEVIIKLMMRNGKNGDEDCQMLANCLECKLPIFLSSVKRQVPLSSGKSGNSKKSGSSGSKRSKTRSKSRSKSPKKS